MTAKTLFVVGAPATAAALTRTGRFSEVMSLPSTSALKAAISDGTIARFDPTVALFLFADSTPVDTPGFDVPVIVERLTSKMWHVALLAVSGVASQVIERSPSAGVIPGPFTINGILGSLSSFLDNPVEPVADSWAFETFNPVEDANVTFDEPAATNSWVDGFSDASLLNSAEAEPQETSPDEIPVEAPADSVAEGHPVDEPAPVESSATVSWAANWVAPDPAPSHEEPASSSDDSPVEDSTSVEQADSPAPAGDMFAASWTSSPAVDTAAVSETADTPAPDTPAPAETTPEVEGGTPAESTSGAFGFSFGGTDFAPTLQSEPSAPSGAQTGDHSYWSAESTQGGFEAAGHGQVISITVAKGGAGKSTLTTNLAVFAAIQLRREGKRVCVVDMDWQQASVSTLLSTYSPNIRDLAESPGDIHPDRIEKYIVESPGVGPCRFLLAPATVHEASPAYITPRLYSQVLSALRGAYDYVFVDTPVAEFHHALFSSCILPSSDYLLCPINPDSATVVSSHKYLEEITASKLMGGAGFPIDRCGYIVNRASDEVGYSTEQVRADMGGKYRYLGQVRDDLRWRRAANAGELMVLGNHPEVNLGFAAILWNLTGEPCFREIVDRAEEAAASRKPRRRLFGR